MPERAYRKMVISLKRNSTFVEAAQFCNCCILFSGLSAPPVTCPYRAEQATGLAGGYDSTGLFVAGLFMLLEISHFFKPYYARNYARIQGVNF